MDSLQFCSDSSWQLLAGLACDFVGRSPLGEGKHEEQGKGEEGSHFNQLQNDSN